MKLESHQHEASSKKIPLMVEAGRNGEGREEEGRRKKEGG